MTRHGWIRVPRAVLESAWYREADPFARALWHLLMSWARFAPGKAPSGADLQPGQLVSSWTAIADGMAWTEKGRRVTPTASKCRRAVNFLRNAGEATYVATGRPAYTGLVVTLERWALYQSDGEQAADLAADVATDRLSEERQDHKNEYGSAGWQPRKTHSEGNSADEIMRREQAARRIREAEDLAELRRVRARERREPPAQDTPATEGGVH